MTEQKPQRKGRDFAIGFGSGLVPLVLSLILMNQRPEALSIAGLFLMLGAGAILFVASLVAFIKQRTFIGLGIWALFAAAPLLIWGACSTL